MRELLAGSCRFGEVRRGIPRISRTMLSARLHELIDAGVIERRHGPGASSEYRLTSAGLELAADLTLRQAVGVGLVLDGRRDWVRAFPSWFERYRFATVASAAPRVVSTRPRPRLPATTAS